MDEYILSELSTLLANDKIRADAWNKPTMYFSHFGPRPSRLGYSTQVLLIFMAGFAGASTTLIYFRGINSAASDGGIFGTIALSSVTLFAIPFSTTVWATSFPTHLSSLDSSTLTFLFLLVGGTGGAAYLQSADDAVSSAVYLLPLILLPASFYALHCNPNTNTAIGNRYRRPAFAAVLNVAAIVLPVVCFYFLIGTAKLVGVENSAFLANVFQFFMLLVFILFKYITRRATTPWLTPLFMLPVIVIGDFFVNFIFITQSLDDWQVSGGATGVPRSETAERGR